MAQFQSLTPGIKVSGRAILTFVAGMDRFRERALRILESHGIHARETEGWYPQQAWLDALKTIAEEIAPTPSIASAPRSRNMPDSTPIWTR